MSNRYPIPGNTLEVATFGKKYSDIASAIADAVAGDTVKVWPGTYTITTQVTMPDNCSLVGVGGHEVTEITTVSDITMVQTGNDCSIEGIHFSHEYPGDGDNEIILVEGTISADVRYWEILDCRFSRTVAFDSPYAIRVGTTRGYLRVEGCRVDFVHMDAVRGMIAVVQANMVSQIADCTFLGGANSGNAVQLGGSNSRHKVSDCTFGLNPDWDSVGIAFSYPIWLAANGDSNLYVEITGCFFGEDLYATRCFLLNNAVSGKVLISGCSQHDAADNGGATATINANFGTWDLTMSGNRNMDLSDSAGSFSGAFTMHLDDLSAGVRTITASATAQRWEKSIDSDPAVPAPVVVTLLTGDTSRSPLTIRDVSGTADSTNTLTVTAAGGDSLDGVAAGSFVIASPYGSVTLEWDTVNSNWIPRAAVKVGNTLEVAKGGKRYTSIASAIADATAGDVIRIWPGTYAEANPLTMPDGVSISCPGGHEVTVLSCNNAGSNGLLLPSNGEVRGLRISGASTVGSAGFVFQAGKTGCECHGISTEDCDIGILSQASTTTNLVRGYSLTEGSATVGVKVEAGKILGVTDAFVFASAGETITSGYHATGASSQLLLNNSFAAAAPTGAMTNGLLVDETGRVDLHGLTLQGATNGLHVGTNGGTVAGLGVDVISTVTYDILSDNAASDISINGFLDSTKFSRTTGDSIVGNWVESFPEGRGTSMGGELHVGSPDQPAETVLGEGDSTTIDMFVYTDDGTGTAFVDETADAVSGTAYTVFPSVAAGGVIYFGNSGREFSGIKINSTTAMVLGAGAVVWEISDGAAGWNAVDIMVTNANAPYTQYAQAALLRIENDQIRFDPDAVTWGDNTVNGQAARWLRCRITVGITTSPVVSNASGASTKLHTNRWECNKDGFTELFGAGIKQFPLAISDRFALTGGGSPTATTFNPSTNITWADADSGYAAAGDGVVWKAEVPFGLDTSRDIEMDVVWKPNDANVTGVVMTLYAVAIRAGDNVPAAAGALTEVNDPNTYTASGVADDVETVQTHSVRLPDVVPGEMLVFSLQRTTAAGGGTPTIEVLNVAIKGSFWSAP